MGRSEKNWTNFLESRKQRAKELIELDLTLLDIVVMQWPLGAKSRRGTTASPPQISKEKV
ncbi:hypothetical protein CLOAM0852 [Candidatus Cloacimonas acidaminovorans str. Evry]|uniref:Uncharacterized protein n=1 Tax=Cloacimonas acidaminovorans (strain Evry) TaxID=459349 RepID=B0VHB8_CLOAI|nr:hypothetical protein CLOAM0852 [Candidatus Cloacimonas acidaminovorans str. Evry]